MHHLGEVLLFALHWYARGLGTAPRRTVCDSLQLRANQFLRSTARCTHRKSGALHVIQTPIKCARRDRIIKFQQPTVVPWHCTRVATALSASPTSQGGDNVQRSGRILKGCARGHFASWTIVGPLCPDSLAGMLVRLGPSSLRSRHHHRPTNDP